MTLRGFFVSCARPAPSWVNSRSRLSRSRASCSSAASREWRALMRAIAAIMAMAATASAADTASRTRSCRASARYEASSSKAPSQTGLPISFSAQSSSPSDSGRMPPRPMPIPMPIPMPPWPEAASCIIGAPGISMRGSRSRNTVWRQIQKPWSVKTPSASGGASGGVSPPWATRSPVSAITASPLTPGASATPSKVDFRLSPNHMLMRRWERKPPSREASTVLPRSISMSRWYCWRVE
ncbi:MAG: hypothetical protein BWZ10_02702 [candidate division BRC1 bacterium ADurb.BinA364]|nr:MAG: hypothetical protein BWZ10_02702 [candidate division BRC1 bacterium ADurb.BinA364]